MKTETALSINGALCSFFFATRVAKSEPAPEVVTLLCEVTLAQAESALEVIEAINANAVSVNGKKTVLCKVVSGVLPELLAEAQKGRAG